MVPLTSGPILIDQVYQRLLEAIATCTIAPGTRIRQGELAERLGVSRQPVSHALHLLKRQGLIEESGRKGFQVTPIDAVRIRQTYEVRGALDGMAARLAAGRARLDEAGAASLQSALADGQAKDVDHLAIPALIELDIAFHRAIYGLSGNPAFEEMVGPSWPHFSRSMAAVFQAAEHRAFVWDEHAAIARHVLAGNADQAEEAARAHALNAGRMTEERLGDVSRAA
ncbi:GntR family transcriptional regulator [Marinivivus vitaminiproducens]|uniref:GntR family transcriptional regulator n=1 Tax=Marinivivus vitaminiproducens TaxID=3035935 RepID=UPI0027990BB9|nr:GntR family transcriptional regulator [Geminicoccaceae bacterium SCSIO 64248]